MIYPPYKSQRELLGKFRNSLPDANIILMDITPQELKDSKNETCYITNQGVLIEFGYIIATEDYYKLLYIFCEETKLEKIHPYVRNETINKYSRNDLKDKILEKVDNRLKAIPSEHREDRKRIRDLEKLLMKR